MEMRGLVFARTSDVIVLYRPQLRCHSSVPNGKISDQSHLHNLTCLGLGHYVGWLAGRRAVQEARPGCTHSIPSTHPVVFSHPPLRSLWTQSSKKAKTTTSLGTTALLNLLAWSPSAKVPFRQAHSTMAHLAAVLAFSYRRFIHFIANSPSKIPNRR